MSNDDSLDEETKKLLEEISKTNDSKESTNKDEKKSKSDILWETNTLEDPDSEW